MQQFLSNIKTRFDKQLLENISYLGIANVTYALSQWLILIIATKFGGVTITSQLSLGLAVSAPVMIFLGSGLRVVISADVQKDYSFGDYFGTRFLSSAIGTIVVLLFALASGYSRDTTIVIGLVGLGKFIEGLQEICWGVSQRQEKMSLVGISRIMRGIGMVSSLVIGLTYTRQLIPSIYLWLLSWVAILLFYDLPKSKQLETLVLRWSPRTWYRVLRRAAPLAFVWGLIALNDKVGQYLISWFEGEEAVGFYAPLSYILQGGALAILTVSETMVPRLSHWFDVDRSLFIKGTARLVLFGGAIGLAAFTGSILFGRSFLQLVYSAEYVEFANVFVILMGFGIVRFAMSGLGNALTAAGLYKIQIPIFLLGLMVTTISGLILIPRTGLTGAAWSSGFGFMTIFILMSLVLLKFGHSQRNNRFQSETN